MSKEPAEQPQRSAERSEARFAPATASDPFFRSKRPRRLMEAAFGAASSEPQEWTVRQWLNRDSWDIYCGDKRIIGDLLKDECEQIADAHNAALKERGGPQEIPLEVALRVTRLQAIVTHGGYEELSHTINAALSAERELVQWCEVHAPTKDEPIKCCPCCESVHERERRKPLVEALEEVAVSEAVPHSLARLAMRALASVKEEK